MKEINSVKALYQKAQGNKTLNILLKDHAFIIMVRLRMIFHRIMTRWLKWSVFGVLFNHRTPMKLKGNFSEDGYTIR